MRYLSIFSIVTLSIFLINSNIRAQSHIYNEKGQLIIDTTLSINNDQLTIWSFAESNIFHFLTTNIKFSPQVKEKGEIGLLIIAFDCDSTGLKNIRSLTKIENGIDRDIIKGITTSEKSILNELKQFSYKGLNNKGTYYIPFDFSLIDLEEIMKKKNVIPLIETQIPGLDIYSH